MTPRQFSILINVSVRFAIVSLSLYFMFRGAVIFDPIAFAAGAAGLWVQSQFIK